MMSKENHNYSKVRTKSIRKEEVAVQKAQMTSALLAVVTLALIYYCWLIPDVDSLWLLGGRICAALCLMKAALLATKLPSRKE